MTNLREADAPQTTGILLGDMPGRNSLGQRIDLITNRPLPIAMDALEHDSNVAAGSLPAATLALLGISVGDQLETRDYQHTGLWSYTDDTPVLEEEPHEEGIEFSSVIFDQSEYKPNIVLSTNSFGFGGNDYKNGK